MRIKNFNAAATSGNAWVKIWLDEEDRALDELFGVMAFASVSEMTANLKFDRYRLAMGAILFLFGPAILSVVGMRSSLESVSLLANHPAFRQVSFIIAGGLPLARWLSVQGIARSDIGSVSPPPHEICSCYWATEEEPFGGVFSL